jgi:phage terminase Nu1 subunit (DNA packaging protein)
VLAREISEVLRLARAGKSAEEVKQRMGHLHNLEADVCRHLGLASSFLADRGEAS